ncbi:dTMP kinase [Bifidobacterium sp. W8109]|nr:thymidylate kinase [Bifidobacterium asteroides PRL2011]MBH9971204.1 dTMP kinase [Bifidobacterium asteroides]MBI0072473.1 dTMP kinase [Bifidobacterium sp. W8110]MBI0099531.1 dTMP kinase [Bifidobacterium sp. W8114]MBH9979999.1 dTMP kinase [Bifidobacterium asteroides]
MSDGLFISFEGVDGAGKTTQVQQAHNYLQERGLRSLVTREPGGTPVGLTIRELVLHGLAAFPSVAVTGGTDVVDASDDLAPRTEALLYAADRAEHVAQVVRPALDRGDIVLCDRYLDSSVAYQAGGRDLSADVIRRLSLWASQGLLPKRTYLLDADPSQSKSRLDHEPDRLESAGDDFQQHVRQAFLQLAQKEPDRFLVIDATQSIDQVWQIIQDDLDKLVEGREPDLPQVDDDLPDADDENGDADGQDDADEDESAAGYEDDEQGAEPDWIEATDTSDQASEAEVDQDDQPMETGTVGGDADDDSVPVGSRARWLLRSRLLRKTR